METRKIEFTESVMIGKVQYEDGDRKAFPKVEADRYIELGWAKCVETGEQGNRKPGAVKLSVDNTVQTL